MGCHLCSNQDDQYIHYTAEEKLKRMKKRQNSSEDELNFHVKNLNESNLQSEQMKQNLKELLALQKDSKVVFNQCFNIEDCKYISFSQRRFHGFREQYEFDQKRLLIGNDQQFKIMSVKTNYQKKHRDLANYESGQSLLCCGSQYYEDPKESELQQISGHIQLILNYQVPLDSTEKIVFASFLEDQDPQYVVVITKDEYEQSSKIYIGKIFLVKEGLGTTLNRSKVDADVTQMSLDERNMTFHAGESHINHNDEQENHVKQQIKRQIYENPSKYKVNKFYMDDNYEVTLDQKSARLVFHTDNGEDELSLEQKVTLNGAFMDTEESPYQMMKEEESVGANGSLMESGINFAGNNQNDTRFANRSISFMDQSMKGNQNRKWHLALKLVQEFRQSVIQRVSYSNSSIYGKVLFTVNSYNQLRVVLFKDIIQRPKTTSNSQFMFDNLVAEPFIEVPNDFIVTRVISLKYEQTTPSSKKSGVVRGMARSNQRGILQVKHPICYADFIIMIYWNQTFFDIFKKNGTILSRQNIPVMQESRFVINTIEDLLLPRLDWSDRYFDMMQQKQNELSKKLIIHGTAYLLEDEEVIQQTRKEYQNMKMWSDISKESKPLQDVNGSQSERGIFRAKGRREKSLSGMSHISKLSDEFTSELELIQEYLKPFIMIYDRTRSHPTIIKLIQVQAFITQLKYGPYDNGHIICGLSNGILLIFNTVDLTRLLQLQLFVNPISLITFDPTKMVLVSSNKGDVAAVSFIENKVKYVYIEMEPKKYYTVQVPLQTETEPSKPTSHYKRRGFLEDSNYSRRSLTPLGGPSLDTSRVHLGKIEKLKSSMNIEFSRKGSSSPFSQS